MDMEWAKDGVSGDLFIVQAWPETVQSRREGTSLRTYSLGAKGEPIVKGLAIGDAAVAGQVCMIASPDDIDHFEDGAILVTENTDPDWVPIMRRAAAIVTDHGGRTSHAASPINSRSPSNAPRLAASIMPGPPPVMTTARLPEAAQSAEATRRPKARTTS